MRLHRTYALWIAPAAVLVLMGAVLAAGGLYPFGGKTISWCDMNQQVIPLLMSFQEIAKGNASMFLNLQNAGGMDFWGVFFFFLASPFTSLTLLVPKGDLYQFMNVLVVLKMAMAAFTASAFFQGALRHLNCIQVSCLSVMYACSGFTMLFYQNIVWLDVVYLFPLLMAGFFRLCRREKPLLFFLSVTAIIVVNYYLSAMVLLWLLLAGAAFAVFAISWARSKRVLLLMALSVTLALLVTGVVWMPSFQEYLNSARTVDLFTSLSSGSFAAPLQTTLPLLLCTALVVAAVVLFFAGHSRSHWNWCQFVLLLLLVLPLLVDPINRMWHLGSYQAFPGRFAYIAVLLGLLVSGWHLEESERLHLHSQKPIRTSPAWLFVTVAAVALCVWIGVTIRTDPALYNAATIYVRTLWGDNNSLLLCGIFAACALVGYLLLFLLFRARKLARPIFCVLLCVLTVTEAALHANIYMAAAGSDGKLYHNVTDLEGRIQDNSLYRLKMDDKYFDANIPGGLGYPSLSHYTSLTNGNYLNAAKWLGYSSYWMEVESSGGTALTDALLAQKYSVALRGTEAGRPVLYQNGDYSIVRQPYTLPFGVMTKSLGTPLSDRDRFDIQEELYHDVLGGTGTLFTRYSPMDKMGVQIARQDGMTHITGAGGRLVYSIPVKRKTILYFDCFDKATSELSRPTYDAFRVTVNGRTIKWSYPENSTNGILELGTFEAGQVVDVVLDVQHDVSCTSFGVVGLDTDRLSAALAQAETADLRQEMNTLTGTVQSKQGGWLLVPVTATDGYSATVNGVAAQTDVAFGTFLTVRVPAGTSTVRISFTPPGFWPGLACTGIGILLAVLFLIGLRRGWYTKLLSFLETPVTVIYEVVALLTFVALYVFPVVVYLAVNAANS